MKLGVTGTLYDLCYHITIHYSHCRVFSHGSLMVVGYVEKHVTMTLRRINMINYIEPPQKDRKGVPGCFRWGFPISRFPTWASFWRFSVDQSMDVFWEGLRPQENAKFQTEATEQSQTQMILKKAVQFLRKFYSSSWLKMLIDVFHVGSAKSFPFPSYWCGPTTVKYTNIWTYTMKLNIFLVYII